MSHHHRQGHHHPVELPERRRPMNRDDSPIAELPVHTIADQSHQESHDVFDPNSLALVLTLHMHLPVMALRSREIRNPVPRLKVSEGLLLK